MGFWKWDSAWKLSGKQQKYKIGKSFLCILSLASFYLKLVLEMIGVEIDIKFISTGVKFRHQINKYTLI